MPFGLTLAKTSLLGIEIIVYELKCKVVCIPKSFQNIFFVISVLQNYTYENYLQCFKKILPIFQYTRNVVSSLNDDLKIQWMGKNVSTYLKVRKNYEHNNETEIFEHTLFLTSLLANALTNAFLTQSQAKHAPYLLKDLINSIEIETVFGLEMASIRINI